MTTGKTTTRPPYKSLAPLPSVQSGQADFFFGFSRNCACLD
uniref:Uncharacterized protein n=1 Tax=Magnetospirillum gryphiswaldense TaxID=55518 RepID=A4TZY0_9PROT|nr:hypothetical protein MGR_1459 [Magnetospirillum gryphiswaldense MSR-1]